MTFGSVLFRRYEDRLDDRGEPDHFGDLNLDQVVAPMVSRREPYDLGAFFHAPLHDVEAVRYRQAACLDLEDERVRKAVDGFAEGMVVMRRRLSHALQLRHRNHRFRWFREAARVYCDTVAALRDELAAADLASEALLALRGYLTDYAASPDYKALADDGAALDEELAAVRYTVQINSGRVTVRRYEGGDDYRHDVEETFSKFEQGDVKDRRVEYSAFSDLNHVEAQVLDLVAELFPDPFRRLADYCTTHNDFIDRRIARFDREVQFYLAWLDFIAPIRSSGLPFCYPEMSTTSKEARVVGSFDVALAAKLARDGRQVVPNDFELDAAERILVVTGPNQGGKTTFARMFGQLHYLAALGLPVPGERVELSLPDRIFAHFEREEKIETLRGKLADELVRVRDMFDRATADSVFVVNEGFSSTTLADALFLGGEVVRRMIDRDLLGVYVTFVDELASLGKATVSMVATVNPDDPAQRTLRVVRQPADGLAYAAAIAGKYGVSYQRLRERINS
ncbi:MAG: DNA mismatch repair protein MutS [Acidimicrobiia bacterium]